MLKNYLLVALIIFTDYYNETETKNIQPLPAGNTG
jgi:hypothetical protein